MGLGDIRVLISFQNKGGGVDSGFVFTAYLAIFIDEMENVCSGVDATTKARV